MLGASEVTDAEALSVTGAVTTGADCGAVTGSGVITTGVREPPRRGAVASTTGAAASLPWPLRTSGSAPTTEASEPEWPRAPRTVEAGPAEGADGPGSDETGSGETGSDDPEPRAPERADPRVAGADECSSEEPTEPTEPAEPVVSANATPGIATNAAPIPNATASTPTRPTLRA
jgi:hypothetical protein